MKVVLKISGELLSSNNIIESVCSLAESEASIAIVVGGGNVIRGRSCDEYSKCVADSVGMLATAINGMLFSNKLQQKGYNTTILSPLQLPFGVQKFNPMTVEEQYCHDRILLFVGGTGMPNVSTDTASVIYAGILHADYILKATKTDGIYTEDPKLNNKAEYLSTLTYDDCLIRGIQIMDAAAFALAKDLKMKIIVFSGYEENCFVRAINGSIKTSCVQ